MTLYKGSTLLSGLDKGNSGIGEIYKGSQLIYQKSQPVNIKRCQYKVGKASNYIFYDTDPMYGYFYISVGRFGRLMSQNKFYSITGTIGTSGSILTIKDYMFDRYYSFDYRCSLLNNNFFVYSRYSSDTISTLIIIATAINQLPSEVKLIVGAGISGSAWDENEFMAKTCPFNNIIINEEDNTVTTDETQHTIQGIYDWDA